MIILGTHAHPAPGEAADRQARALSSWRALDGVTPINLQFRDAVVEVDGFETLPVLCEDSVRATGRAGLRKAVASEVFGLLARLARDRHCERFAFVNADILISQAAIDLARAPNDDVCLFSRMDVEPQTGRDLGLELAGIDAFFVRADWWFRHERRFRPYLIGERLWDNVYCAQMLCHGRGMLHNRNSHIRHVRHDARWTTSPFMPYVLYLGALDSPYFSLWCDYYSRLEALRGAGASEAAERSLQHEVFAWRPSPVGRVVQLGRAIRAHLRYHVQQYRDRAASRACTA